MGFAIASVRQLLVAAEREWPVAVWESAMARFKFVKFQVQRAVAQVVLDLGAIWFLRLMRRSFFAALFTRGCTPRPKCRQFSLGLGIALFDG